MSVVLGAVRSRRAIHATHAQPALRPRRAIVAALRFLVSIGAIARGANAAAAGSSARLVYQRAADAASCADEDGIRAAVVRRLGRDPFVAPGEMTLFVEVRRGARRGYFAELRVVRDDGVAAGGRVLESKSDDCRELVHALALTMSLVVDPVRALEGGAELDAQTVPASADRAPPSTAPALHEPSHSVTDSSTSHDSDRVLWAKATPDSPAPPPSPERLRPILAVAAFASAGEGLAPTLGGIAHVSARFAWLSLGVEARADLSSQRGVADGGSFRSSSVSGWLVPCAESGWLSGCALVGAGGLFAKSVGVSSTRSDQGAYFGLGARVAATFEPIRTIIVCPFVDGVVQPFEAQYRLGGATLYRMSAVGVDTGLMVGARFP